MTIRLRSALVPKCTLQGSGPSRTPRKELILKRSFFVALSFAAAASFAALFGGQADAKSAPAPTPSAAPSALPTATPEPPDKAIPRLLDILKKNPNDQEALSQLAQQYIGIGRSDLALPLTQKLIQMGSRTAQTYYFDGYANEQLGRIPQAVADYENASNLDPTNIGVLGSLTQVYLKTNRLADAERVAKRAVTFNKTDRRAFVNYGLVLASEAKYDDARTQFETAYKMDSTDVTPLLQIGQTYMSQNNAAQAIASIDRALAADPKNGQAYVFKADVLAKQHDIVNALAAYEQAANYAPDDESKAGIIAQEASFLASEKKNSDAEAAFARGIAKYPTVLGTHIAFGDYWNNQKQIGKAIAEWQLGLGPNKDNPAALVRLGSYAMKTNNPAQAIEYLRKLAEVQPDPQGLAILGQAYTMRHDYANAKRACQGAYQMQPAPQSLGCIAGADFELKNYKESAQIFDLLDARVGQYLTSNPQLLYIAGKVYQNTNQPAKAKNEYSRLLKMMKPGTSSYKQVQQILASLNSKAPKGKTKHG